MATKADFIATYGALRPFGMPKEFVRSSGNILTASAHGLQTGAGPYKLMTTSGTDLPASLVAAVRSSGTFTASTVIATDLVVVDGKTFTFIATPGADGDVDVGGDDATSMNNLAKAINLAPSPAATTYHLDTVGSPNVFAEARGAVVTVYAKTLSHTVGDAIAISSPDSTITESAATLAGGASGTDYYIIRLSADTFSFATSKANALAGTVVALTDAGTGVHTLVATIETFAASLEDMLTNFLTHPGTRVQPPDYMVSEFWAAAIDGVGGSV